MNAAATSLRMRVCSGGSTKSRLQRSTSQNACHCGSSGSALNSRLGADVPEVAPEPPVAQAGADVGVARDEPAVEPLVVVDGGRLAQRVRAADTGRPEMQAPADRTSRLLPRADVLEKAVHPSATSAESAMHRPMIPKTRPTAAAPPPPSLVATPPCADAHALASASATTPSTTVTGIAKPAWSRS